ncbi:MAG: V-type ATP synthase subunit A, partial [Treponemataceae bacterium]
MIDGKIVRVSGPIVRATGLGSAGLYDVVEVGDKRLIGEIVRLEGNDAIVQVYEDDTGLPVGASARSIGRPLSALLGPGLIGTIYDGIQRPLKALFDSCGSFLAPGVRGDPLDSQKKWRFVPSADLLASLSRGDKVAAKPGLSLGSVQETPLVTCKIMVPPNFPGKTIEWIAGEGDYTIEDVVARAIGGAEIRLAQWWPVRVARPYARKLTVDEPLITGQRVIDIF